MSAEFLRVLGARLRAFGSGTPEHDYEGARSFMPDGSVRPFRRYPSLADLRRDREEREVCRRTESGGRHCLHWANFAPCCLCGSEGSLDPCATRAPDCTGLTARWCPQHGDCRCPMHGDMDADDCPLHGGSSDHPRPLPTTPEGLVLRTARMVERGYTYEEANRMVERGEDR